MQSAEASLRIFLARRRQVVAELPAAGLAGALLVAIASPVESGATPDVRALFMSVCVLFAVSAVALVTRAVPVLLFRCPRCREPFHGVAARALFAMCSFRRECAHCRLGSRRADEEPKRTLS